MSNNSTRHNTLKAATLPPCLRRVFLVLWLLLPLLSLKAQELQKGQKPSEKYAEYCIKFGNYHDGLTEYTFLLQEKPDNPRYHLGIAICYLHLNNDGIKAKEHLLKAVSYKKCPPEAWYQLGLLYLESEEPDAARQALKKYRSLTNDDKHTLSAQRLLQMCDNAVQAIKNPVNVKILNMGKRINTPWPEYYPFIPANESMLVFNRNSKYNLGTHRFYDGKYPSDVYVSYNKFGRWKRAKRLGNNINSYNIDEVVGLTSDGSMMLLVRQDLKGGKQTWYSIKRGRYFRDLKPLFIADEKLKHIYTLSMSPNHRFIIFSAVHKNGRGGKDLYYSIRLPDGSWSPSQSLDTLINTPYDEDFPYFSPDGKYLFFASTGHNSMGGYDIFKTTFTFDSLFHFAKPQNLGYPVNTTRDDKTISLSRSGRYGYISSYRKGGLGGLDIYRVIFKDVQPVLSVVSGYILNSDSLPFTLDVQGINQHIDTLNIPINREYKRLLLKKKDSSAAYAKLAEKIPWQNVDVHITATNLDSGKPFGRFRARNDNAHYAVILPPGRWKIVFRRQGYHSYVIPELTIPERDQRPKIIKQNIVLKPLSDSP